MEYFQSSSAPRNPLVKEGNNNDMPLSFLGFSGIYPTSDGHYNVTINNEKIAEFNNECLRLRKPICFSGGGLLYENNGGLAWQPPVGNEIIISAPPRSPIENTHAPRALPPQISAEYKITGDNLIPIANDCIISTNPLPPDEKYINSFAMTWDYINSSYFIATEDKSRSIKLYNNAAPPTVIEIPEDPHRPAKYYNSAENKYIFVIGANEYRLFLCNGAEAEIYDIYVDGAANWHYKKITSLKFAAHPQLEILKPQLIIHQLLDIFAICYSNTLHFYYAENMQFISSFSDKTIDNILAVEYDVITRQFICAYSYSGVLYIKLINLAEILYEKKLNYNSFALHDFEMIHNMRLCHSATRHWLILSVSDATEDILLYCDLGISQFRVILKLPISAPSLASSSYASPSSTFLSSASSSYASASSASASSASASPAAPHLFFHRNLSLNINLMPVVLMCRYLSQSLSPANIDCALPLIITCDDSIPQFERGVSYYIENSSPEVTKLTKKKFGNILFGRALGPKTILVNFAHLD